MSHTTMRQHRTFCKGTWQPTSCATTITNPVGQQPTPTHCRRSTRGSKRERNLHTEGHSSPYNPPICRRQIRGIRNRRTDRHTGNHQTITGNLHATPPSKRWSDDFWRSEEHTSELQSHSDLVCRLLLEKS